MITANVAMNQKMKQPMSSAAPFAIFFFLGSSVNSPRSAAKIARIASMTPNGIGLVG